MTEIYYMYQDVIFCSSFLYGYRTGAGTVIVLALELAQITCCIVRSEKKLRSQNA